MMCYCEWRRNLGAVDFNKLCDVPHPLLLFIVNYHLNFVKKTINLRVKAINYEVPPASIARNVVHKRAKESCALF